MRRLTRRQLACVACAFVAAIASVVSASSLASVRTQTSLETKALPPGEKLYREYCGQCHALAVAFSAGFGSQSNGLGSNGGPSFNALRIPIEVSIVAVSEPTGGHEEVKKKITWTQLLTVAEWLAKVTHGHPIPAYATDG